MIVNPGKIPNVRAKSPQHVLRLVPTIQEQGCDGTGRLASGAGVPWNRIPDTVRQRLVDPADEVGTRAP